jgi:hypothetical protein
MSAYPSRYPSGPSNGPVYLTYPVAEGVEQVELRLHDATGRMLANHRLAPKAGILELRRTDLPSGLVLGNLYWDGIRVADVKMVMMR